MIRVLFRALGGTSLALVLLSFTAAPAWAENVTYPDEFPPKVLQNISDSWGRNYENSLAPSGSDSGTSPNLSGNRITLNSGTVEHVFGAVAHSSGAVTNNQVFINSGMVDNFVYGGAVYSNSGSAMATGNSVYISGGEVGNTRGGHAWVVSGSGDAEATGNRVTISGNAEVVGWIQGAWARTDNGSVLVSGNTVAISGNASVDGSVVGGQVRNNVSGNAEASGNTVFISGNAEVSEDVFGGWAYSNSGIATATNNIVTITGNPNLAGASLFGGFTDGSGAGDAFSGNTLYLAASNLTVAGLSNFQYLNFILPSTMKAGDTMLNVAGVANLGTDARVDVGVAGSGSPLQVGCTVKLIDASAGTLDGTLDNSTADGSRVVGKHGVTLRYVFDLLLDTASGLLTATVTDVGVNEQDKAFSEGFVGGMALVTQGADAAAGQGMTQAVAAASGAGEGSGLAGFGSMSGGSMRLNSGSHVDMNSFSIITGLAKGWNINPGRLTLGGFFEFGTGSYDTYNSFSNAPSVKGKGDTYYYGLGMLGRMDCSGTEIGNFYTEGSIRTGRLHNEYRSDLTDMMGNRAKYDFSTPYYGFHLGGGYIWNINDKASLDLHAKYFWTRVEGSTVTLSTGDRISFKDADSSRTRLGSRFSYAVSEQVSPYIGAAWEHEFDGRARATTSGFDIPAPSLRGDTGIGEIGLTFRPSQSTMPLSFDLGVQGYTGKREGVTGSLQLRFEF